MNLVPKIPLGRQVIHAYGNGGFRIADQTFKGSVLVFAERTLPWPVRDIAEVSFAALAEVVAAEPKIELLLLGTGATMAAPDPAIKHELRGLGIALETLDTGAACRTFNVLLSEERRVAAALIAVG
jgi:uncharacterized protein